MQQRSAPPSRRRGPVGVEQAEAALFDHYPRLVRMAYLTLPAAQGKHRRLLAAHAVVQRALPRGQNENGRAPAAPAPPSGRGAGTASGSSAEAAYALVRQETLRRALAHGDGAGRWNRVRRTAQRAAWPWVWGLRLHPMAGGMDEFALDRALSGLGAAARAAAALRGLEGLDDRAVREVLGAAGVTNPRAALAQASAVGAPSALHAAGDFDPCTVQARPTDLLRRRQHARTAAVSAMAAATAAAVLALSVPGDTGPEPYAAAGALADRTTVRAPAALVRAGADAWTNTSRLDFTVWPARGGRKRDTELLREALAVWAHPGPRVQVSSTPGTVRTPPAQPPQLLYAGDLDAATVVLFFDGLRIVRYARPQDDGADAALDFARVDGADLTTAAAVVLGRTDTNARFLTAPWVAGAQTRDLLRPDRAALPLQRNADGVTGPVPMPGAGSTGGGAAGAGGVGSGCGSAWTVLQLSSSPRIAPRHTFLLTDLGELTPVHLTYTPRTADRDQDPGAAGTTGEATAAAALRSWAHTACGLGELRGRGVRSVGDWEFAQQPLPEGGGPAAWVCTRAETWRGPGQAVVRVVTGSSPAAAPGAVAARAERTGACGRFSRPVLAGVMWKSPAGHWFLVAAGSREVNRIEASGGVRATADGSLLAVRAERGTRASLTARLSSGGTLDALT